MEDSEKERKKLIKKHQEDMSQKSDKILELEKHDGDIDQLREKNEGLLR